MRKDCELLLSCSNLCYVMSVPKNHYQVDLQQIETYALRCWQNTVSSLSCRTSDCIPIALISGLWENWAIRKTIKSIDHIALIKLF